MSVMGTMSDVLSIEHFDQVARLTLNRPEQRNALNRSLRMALAKAFRDLAEASRVIVLTGSGAAFCAGFDLAELAAGGDNAADAGADFSTELIPAIADYPGPIIAAVNGAAATAGFELALACDLMIASTAAKFADTHARVGILPGWGLSQRLPRLIGIARAKELSFTGNFVAADLAYEWGLVNRVVAPEQLLPAAHELADDMISSNPGTLVAYKRLIDEGFAMPLAQAMRHEADAALASAQALTGEVAGARKESLQKRFRNRSSDD